MTITNITNCEDWHEAQKKSNARGFVLGVLVYAEWHEPSMQLIDVLDRLHSEYTAISLAKADADAVSELVKEYKVESVPTVLFFEAGKVISRIEGADAPLIVESVSKFSARPASSLTNVIRESSNDSNDVRARIHRLIRADSIVLFMKGTPESPQCGFSRQMIEILARYVPGAFGFYNILDDRELRAELKIVVNWKTYPMLFVNGELLGGLDVIKELDNENELADALKRQDHQVKKAHSKLDERLSMLIRRSRIMLFMKGSSNAPQCGFSRTIINLLNEYHVEFDTFDILTDDEIREGLKIFSSWKTYPQLYVDGELIGGLDIVKELHDDGELRAILSA